jgi:hypothetical protein
MRNNLISLDIVNADLVLDEPAPAGFLRILPLLLPILEQVKSIVEHKRCHFDQRRIEFALVDERVLPRRIFLRVCDYRQY